MDEAPPKFALPVDSEHKAKALNLLSLSRPHMLSFHLNWIGFFITFLAAYAAAPLIPIIRDSLNLEQHQANIAGKPSFALHNAFRLAGFLGPCCLASCIMYTYDYDWQCQNMLVYAVISVGGINVRSDILISHYCSAVRRSITRLSLEYVV